jgi:hypothetical protein
MSDKKIISKVMVHPTEFVNAQARYYNDSDIGKKLSGTNTINIVDSQDASFYSADKLVTTTASLLNTSSNNASYLMIKNKSNNDVLLAVDGNNFDIAIKKNDVFSSQMNSVGFSVIKVKTSTGTSNIEYIAAQ